MKNKLLALLLFSCPLATQALEPLPSPPQVSERGGVYDGTPIQTQPVSSPRATDPLLEKRGFNSQVLSLKVTPVVGYPYYLRDRDGDGGLENDLRELDGVRVPEWILLSW